jgi:hypothetical protein
MRKMQIAQRTAMAPAEPSTQDRAVETAAARREAEARTERREQQAQQQQSPAMSSGARCAYLSGAAAGGRRPASSLDLIVCPLSMHDCCIIMHFRCPARHSQALREKGGFQWPCLASDR